MMGPPEGCAPASGTEDSGFRSTNEHRGPDFEPTSDSLDMQIDASGRLLPPPSSVSRSGGDGQDLTEDVKAAVERSQRAVCMGVVWFYADGHLG